MVNVASYKSIQEFFCALNFAKIFLINQEKPLTHFCKKFNFENKFKISSQSKNIYSSYVSNRDEKYCFEKGRLKVSTRKVKSNLQRS